jgi:hypothetical protein
VIVAILNDAIAGLRPLFDAIPTGKWKKVEKDAVNVENGLRQAAGTLQAIRKFYLETERNGEDLPFVKAIDNLLDRPDPKPKKGGSDGA